MVCIQVYFWNSLRPLYKKNWLFFFHKGSSELSVIMFMFRAMKGKNKFIITVKPFFFFKYICCHLWLQFGGQSAVGPRFPAGSYSSSQWSQYRNVRLLGKQIKKKMRTCGVLVQNPRLWKIWGVEGKKNKKKKLLPPRMRQHFLLNFIKRYRQKKKKKNLQKWN